MGHELEDCAVNIQDYFDFNMPVRLVNPAYITERRVQTPLLYKYTLTASDMWKIPTVALYHC